MKHNTNGVKRMLSLAVAVGLLSASSYAQAAPVSNAEPTNPNRPTAIVARLSRPKSINF